MFYFTTVCNMIEHYTTLYTLLYSAILYDLYCITLYTSFNDVMLYLCEAQAPVRYWSLMLAATSYLELSHAEKQPIV